MVYDPAKKFVQPAEGIVVLSSPVLTDEQLAALERDRLKKIEKIRLGRERDTNTR